MRPEGAAATLNPDAGAGGGAGPPAEADGAALGGPAGGPSLTSLRAAAAGLDRAAMRLKDALAALEAAERAAPPLRDR